MSRATAHRPPPSRSEPGTFVSRVLSGADGESRYQVYLPPDFAGGHPPWPVTLFLHGAGERGADGAAQVRVGLGAALRQHPERYPRLTVFPQCSAGSFWTEPAMAERARRALALALAEFHGDPARVVLTGLSMGGYGAVAMAAEQPQRFTALVAICGGVQPPPAFYIPPAPIGKDAPDPYRFLASRLKALPVWLFHGARDDVVPVQESQRLAAALQEAGAAVRYTEYPRIAHEAWVAAYQEPALAAWLASY